MNRSPGLTTAPKGSGVTNRSERIETRESLAARSLFLVPGTWSPRVKLAQLDTSDGPDCRGLDGHQSPIRQHHRQVQEQTNQNDLYPPERQVPDEKRNQQQMRCRHQERKPGRAGGHGSQALHQRDLYRDGAHTQAQPPKPQGRPAVPHSRAYRGCQMDATQLGGHHGSRGREPDCHEADPGCGEE